MHSMSTVADMPNTRAKSKKFPTNSRKDIIIQMEPEVDLCLRKGLTMRDESDVKGEESFHSQKKSVGTHPIYDPHKKLAV